MIAFDYRFDHVGGCELSCSDGRTRYLQGEDADPIRELDEYLDANEFPNAGLDTAADAIDATLSPYFDEV